MPHYKNGRTAWIGDVVRGIGYNVKDDKGNPAEVVGTVVGLEPSRDECNIQIAVAKVFPVKFGAACEGEHGEGAWLGPENQRPEIVGDGQKSIKGDGPKIGATLFVEYGACNTFELVIGIMREIRLNGKPILVRPIINTSDLSADFGSNYSVYKEHPSGEFWKDEPIADCFLEVKDGDKFYVIPPARI